MTEIKSHQKDPFIQQQVLFSVKVRSFSLNHDHRILRHTLDLIKTFFWIPLCLLEDTNLVLRQAIEDAAVLKQK